MAGLGVSKRAHLLRAVPVGGRPLLEEQGIRTCAVAHPASARDVTNASWRTP